MWCARQERSFCPGDHDVCPSAAPARLRAPQRSRRDPAASQCSSAACTGRNVTSCIAINTLGSAAAQIGRVRAKCPPLPLLHARLQPNPIALGSYSKRAPSVSAWFPSWKGTCVPHTEKNPVPTHTGTAEGIYGTTSARLGFRSTFPGTNTPLSCMD